MRVKLPKLFGDKTQWGGGEQALVQKWGLQLGKKNFGWGNPQSPRLKKEGKKKKKKRKKDLHLPLIF